MKNLLIIPNIQGKYFKPGQPHVGVAYLAGALMKQNGFHVKIIDMRLGTNTTSLAKQITRYNPTLIGITITTLNYQVAYQLITNLKKQFNDIPLVIGGPHVTTFATTILEETTADFAVIGEGEITLVELAHALQQESNNFDSITGLVWRNRGKIETNQPRKAKIDLDTLTFPRYDLSPLGEYIDNKIPILTSRGCPGRCVYCSVNSLFGRAFRTRSPENVFAEISYWHKQGYKYFIINDDCFTAAIPRAEKICDLIIEKNLNIRWECRNGIRMDRLNTSLAKKMKRAGCCFVAFGLESANQNNLNAMNKGLSLDQAQQAIDIMRKTDIDFGLFFMIGTPGDTYHRFLDSYHFAKKSGAQEVRFYNAIPYPGTDFFDWVQKNGHFLYPPKDYLNNLDRWDETPVFETNDFPKEERTKAFNLGEELVMRAFFKKYFGAILAPLCWQLYRNKYLRTICQKPGELVWMALRKRHLNKTIRDHS